MKTLHTAAQAVLSHRLGRRRLMAQTAAGLTATAFATFAPRVTRAADPASGDLDQVLKAAIEQGLPGIALQVDRAGETIYAGTAGFASIEQQTPLTIDHRFRLGSVAKATTALTVLQLVDEGTLSLDDTVTEWLDDPAVLRIPNVERVTLRRLLNHTSGIYDFADEADSPLWNTYLGANPDWTKVWTLDELLAFADGANHPPYFEPGQSWAYSNTGYVLLGLIVEKATGHRLASEVQDRVLAPLALEDMFLAEGSEIPEGTADCYQFLGGELVNTTSINLSWTWACGWAVSTISDFARFGRALIGGELVSPASHQEQFTFVPDPRSMALGWGFGVWSQPSAHGQVIGGGGDGPGFTVNLSHLVTHDLTVTIALNSAGTDYGTGGIRDAALAAVIG